MPFSMKDYFALTLILASLTLQGCVEVAGIAVAAHFQQDDFDSGRAMLKGEWWLGQLSHDQARKDCLTMLTQADQKHAAPPPYDEGVCDFGSPWDLRYELEKSIEQGLVSPGEWSSRCEGIPNRPNEPFCQYDPLVAKLNVWKAQLSTMRAGPEAVLFDCQRLFLNRQLPNGPTSDICKF